MPGFYKETRVLPEGVSLSRDLAQHIFMRSAKGGVVVVTERPMDILSTTKKQWNMLIRQVERERASTLKLARIAELSNQIDWMRKMTFVAKPPHESMENYIAFTTAENLKRNPSACLGLYILQQLNSEQLEFITAGLPDKGVVIVYEAPLARQMRAFIHT